VPPRQDESMSLPELPVQETLSPPIASGAAGHGDAWADSVLGGLEDHPPCQHCLISPWASPLGSYHLEGQIVSGIILKLGRR